VDGVVEMMLDATQKYQDPMTEERLFGWHAAPFPTGRSGMRKIMIGDWRDDRSGIDRIPRRAQALLADANQFAANSLVTWADPPTQATDRVAMPVVRVVRNSRGDKT
jgi:hypothetical protein